MQPSHRKATVSAVSKAIMVALAFLTTPFAWSAEYFVMDTQAESGITPENARIATMLVKNSVISRPGEAIVQDEGLAEYVLQPRLIRLGDSYILTIEKSRAGEIIYATQSKFERIDDLDQAAQRATRAAILEPEYGRRGIASEERPSAPYAETPPTGTPQTVLTVDEAGRIEASRAALLPSRKIGYLTVGMGPFVGEQMNTDNILYEVAVGYTWDLNPQVSLKLLGEGAFPTGDENGHYYNIGAGASFYLLTDDIDSAPFLSADLGYGWAKQNQTGQTTNGANAGVAIGYQFFRTTQTTLDVLFRYTAILNSIDGGGNPQILGLRVAVNF